MVLAGAGKVGGLGQQAGGHLHHQGGDQVLQGQVQGSQQGASIFPPEWQLQLQTLAG